MKIKALVLEVVTGTYEGNEWARIKARSADTANKILAYKVDLKKVALADVQDAIDQEVDLTLAVVAGSQDKAEVKVVAVN